MQLPQNVKIHVSLGYFCVTIDVSTKDDDAVTTEYQDKFMPREFYMTIDVNAKDDDVW